MVLVAASEEGRRRMPADGRRRRGMIVSFEGPVLEGRRIVESSVSELVVGRLVLILVVEIGGVLHSATACLQAALWARAASQTLFPVRPSPSSAHPLQCLWDAGRYLSSLTPSRCCP